MSETNRKVEIYALLDPRDGAIRYIGKANDSAKRLKGHMRDARRRVTPVYNWINALAKMGLTPGMTVLLTPNVEEWPATERAAIPDRQEDENGEPIGGYGRVKGNRYGAPLQALA